MKKILKLLFILSISLIITSCGPKDFKEGQLVEISGLELTNNFAGDNAKDFIFAIVDETEKDYKQYLIDLEKYAKETNKAIYFTYYKHLDSEAVFYIFNLYEANFTTNSFHVIENGELTITQDYISYNLMYQSLENKRFYTTLDYISDEEAAKYMKSAQEEYEKGNVSKSLNYINKIWNRKEAKDYFYNHKELGIVKSWEHSEITEGKRDRITYRSLLFHNDVNYFLEIETKSYYDTFEKPLAMKDYEQVFYYVKDDIIYTSKKEDGTYKERFKILEIRDTSFKLYDYQYKKEYTYTRRV